jgi:PAS domain S-box-containing protein
MKNKIILAVSLICLFFVLGGTYIIYGIENATAKLDHLVTLHQVEILREQLLINTKKVESDLKLRNTPHATGMDTVIDNVVTMETTMAPCYDCHLSKEPLRWLDDSTNDRVLDDLKDLTSHIEEYKDSLSRFLTMRANSARTAIEFNRALDSAHQLVTQVNDMVHSTSVKLSEKTISIYDDVSKTKTPLYLLIVAAPFLAAVFGFLFTRELTKPVNLLLEATRRLTAGDLDHKIKGMTDEFGEVAASFNKMSDSLKEHMHKIEESERRYRTLFESAGDAIFIVEAEGEEPGKIVDANPAAAEMHGYTVDELLELNLIKDLNTPDAAKDAPDRVRRMFDGEWIQAEITHRKKDGTVFPVGISAGLLEYMDHKYILAVDRDISERKEMEDLILQAKLEWEDTFDTITDMITIQDRDFNIIRANKTAGEILGLPFSEITRAKCYEYYHGKDCPPEECVSCECFETEEPTAFEYFEPHLNKFLEMRAIPRFDNHNQMIGLIHIVRDITERKRVEEALQRTDQMKIVGEWATGLVHEIKNPLAGIKGSVELLAAEQNITGEDRVVISMAVDEIKRIETLLKSLLNFAKPPKPQLTVVELNDLLDKTISFSLRHPSLSSDTTATMSVVRDFDEKVPTTMADPMQLQQVFLNLLFNAIEAMTDGGTLTTTTHYDAELNAIQILISDTGTGIEKEIIDNIFQPFFTTKRKGMGLGLAITRRLVEQHGGDIYVESDPGKGTVFNILLRVNEVDKEQLT